MALWGRAMMAILVLLVEDITMATQYTVGGEAGWTLQTSNGVYDTQFAKITLFVGDTLLFPFTAPAHNVYDVAPSAIASCDFTNPIAFWTESNPVITLSNSGKKAFGCQLPTHCSSFGMSLTVTVSANAPVAAPPTPLGTLINLTNPSNPGPNLPSPVSPPLQAPAPTSTPPAPAPASPQVSAPITPSTPSPISPLTQISARITPPTPSPTSSPRPRHRPHSLQAPVASAIIAPKAGGGGIKVTTIVGIAVGGAAAVVLLAVILVCLVRNKSEGKLGVLPCFGCCVPSYNTMAEFFVFPSPSPARLEAGAARAAGAAGASNHKFVPPAPEVTKVFTYKELKKATDGFSPSNALGEGGFGRVYRGTIAGNELVAVKQLILGRGQGDSAFRAEVEIISRVHHRNLVSLVGYCINDSMRLLVYKFVPNGTLEFALHGEGQPLMNWATRMNIARGAARGLAYLHEDCNPRIIHRDIKGSNILLDNEWEAQVADFGLAKLADDGKSHLTTRIMGTFAYLAPEYASSGKLTEKSDVYSFGVVLLELITGKPSVNRMAVEGQERSLVEWARPFFTWALESGDVDGLVDPKLEDNYDKKAMFKMVEIAAACVRHSFLKRPKMAMVSRALEMDDTDLNQGVMPGHSHINGKN